MLELMPSAADSILDEKQSMQSMPPKGTRHEVWSSEGSLSGSGSRSECEDLASLRARLTACESRLKSGGTMAPRGECEKKLRNTTAAGPMKIHPNVLSPNLKEEVAKRQVKLPRRKTPGGTMKIGSDARAAPPQPPPRPKKPPEESDSNRDSNQEESRRQWPSAAQIAQRVDPYRRSLNMVLGDEKLHCQTGRALSNSSASSRTSWVSCSQYSDGARAKAVSNNVFDEENVFEKQDVRAPAKVPMRSSGYPQQVEGNYCSDQLVFQGLTCAPGRDSFAGEDFSLIKPPSPDEVPQMCFGLA